MLDLQPAADGVILPVHAHAGARKNGVTGIHAGRLKLAVTQAPEKGKANRAFVDLLADILNLNRSQISLVAGETSNHKKFMIRGIDPQTLQARLDGLINC